MPRFEGTFLLPCCETGKHAKFALAFQGRDAKNGPKAKPRLNLRIQTVIAHMLQIRRSRPIPFLCRLLQNASKVCFNAVINACSKQGAYVCSRWGFMICFWKRWRYASLVWNERTQERRRSWEMASEAWNLAPSTPGIAIATCLLQEAERCQTSTRYSPRLRQKHKLSSVNPWWKQSSCSSFEINLAKRFLNFLCPRGVLVKAWKATLLRSHLPPWSMGVPNAACQSRQLFGLKPWWQESQFFPRVGFATQR